MDIVSEFNYNDDAQEHIYTGTEENVHKSVDIPESFGGIYNKWPIAVRNYTKDRRRAGYILNHCLIKTTKKTGQRANRTEPKKTVDDCYLDYEQPAGLPYQLQVLEHHGEGWEHPIMDDGGPYSRFYVKFTLPPFLGMYCELGNYGTLFNQEYAKTLKTKEALASYTKMHPSVEKAENAKFAVVMTSIDAESGDPRKPINPLVEEFALELERLRDYTLRAAIGQEYHVAFKAQTEVEKKSISRAEMNKIVDEVFTKVRDQRLKSEKGSWLPWQTRVSAVARPGDDPEVIFQMLVKNAKPIRYYFDFPEDMPKHYYIPLKARAISAFVTSNQQPISDPTGEWAKINESGKYRSNFKITDGGLPFKFPTTDFYLYDDKNQIVLDSNKQPVIDRDGPQGCRGGSRFTGTGYIEFVSTGKVYGIKVSMESLDLLHRAKRSKEEKKKERRDDADSENEENQPEERTTKRVKVDSDLTEDQRTLLDGSDQTF